MEKAIMYSLKANQIKIKTIKLLTQKQGTITTNTKDKPTEELLTWERKQKCLDILAHCSFLIQSLRANVTPKFKRQTYICNQSAFVQGNY